MVYSLAPRTREWGDRVNEKIDVISRFLRCPVFVKTYKKEKWKEKKIFWRTYRKILQISPGIYIFQRSFWGAYIRTGLSTEGNLRFKIDWARLIFGSKFTVFALFYFVFEGNFRSTSPRGAYIWRGDLTEGFLRYRFRGLYWRRLFSEFYGAFLYTRTALQVAEPCGASKHPCPSCSKVG